MSQENVETVQRIYDGISHSQPPPLELFGSEFEMDMSEVAPDFGLVRGVEAAQEAMQTYWETFEDFHIEVREVIHADRTRVVTAVRDGGRIKGSEAEVWNDYFNVWAFRGTQIVRQSVHLERRRALEAAGLSE
jgi:ketosteroid isomerase-like protein